MNSVAIKGITQTNKLNPGALIIRAKLKAGTQIVLAQTPRIKASFKSKHRLQARPKVGNLSQTTLGNNKTLASNTNCSRTSQLGSLSREILPAPKVSRASSSSQPFNGVNQINKKSPESIKKISILHLLLMTKVIRFKLLTL